MSAWSWTAQLRAVGRAMQVSAVDLPGHGQSDTIPEPTVKRYAEAAGRLLNAPRTGPVFLAGHSLGGGVALAMAALAPARVKGLILISTCGKLLEPESSPGRVLYWFLPAWLRKLVFFSALKKVLFGPTAPGWATRLGMEEFRSCRPETLLQDVAAARAMDMEEQARSLRAPTLILCGDRERVTPPALSQRLHVLTPGSRLENPPGAGHMLPLEAAGQVNHRLLDFLEALVPGALPQRSYVGGVPGVSFSRRVAPFWSRRFSPAKAGERKRVGGASAQGRGTPP